MFNHVLSIAAFGFIAFVLVFVHPALHGSHIAAREVAATGKIANANLVAANMRPRGGASK